MVLFFLTSQLAQSQVQGIVFDKNSKEPIPYVNILVKTLDKQLLDYTSTDTFGKFIINLPIEHDKLIIETSIISHLETSKEIVVAEYNNSTKKLIFNLKERLTELEEVYVEGVKKPITIKKDTTVYSINQFKDGTERVVEDLLKKLPGITVTESGIIKFKGKQVVRLLLDGDNLFDANYTIGSRNINSDIIESVEAIEDYNINPLLKGVKSSEDVAMNLILKEGKVDVSGDAEVGLGVKDKTYLKANLISVSKKLKGFGTFSHNNIGENDSPFNFVSNSLDISALKEADSRTTNLINNNGFNSSLPDSRTRVNNNFFGSLNSLYKINNKVSFRVNYNLFKDRLKREEKLSELYNFDDTQLNIASQYNTSRKPTLHNLSYESIYHINNKSLLTVTGKFENKKIKENSFGFNNDQNFSTTSKSKDVFFISDAEYTFKVTNKSVLQLASSFSTNKIPQNLNSIVASEQNFQDINLKKTAFNFQSNYFVKQKDTEYGISLGYNYETNSFISSLEGIVSNTEVLGNNLIYTISKPYINLSYNLQVNRWQFLADIKNKLVNVKLKERGLDNNSNAFAFNPSLTLKYYINKNAHYYINYDLSNQTPEISNIYSGLILRDFRTLTNNDFKFNLFNNHTYTLGYRINDFYNLFQFNLFGKYDFSKYAYVNKFNISEAIDFNTSIVDVTNNENYYFGIDLEKYIHFLRSTINFNSSYSINKYQNILNDSELRTNKSKTLFSKFQIRTGFKSVLNFENQVSVRNNVFDNLSGSSNAFTSLQNDFKTKIVKENFQFIFNTQYFKPDLSNNVSGDLFLDASIYYKPNKSKIQYCLKANNLLNNKIYQNINTSDFSTSIFQHNLQERFFLLSIQFKY